VFFDIHGIDGGADFPTVIDANLRHAKVILACWSPLYFERKPPPDWCIIECRFGLTQQKLVPVAIERFSIHEAPVDLHGVNWFDLTAWRGQDEHEDWQRTLTTLSRFLGSKPVDLQPKASTAAPHPPQPMSLPPLPPILRAVALKINEPQTAVPAPSRPGPASTRSSIPIPEMVRIPAGVFMMGSAEGAANERPVRRVRIEAFELGKYPVTFAEWDAAIAAGARLDRGFDEGWGRDRRPVINVHFKLAKDYIDWLNGKLGLEGRTDAYRLPSEAEWEYACRAGTTTPYSFGTSITKAQAQFSEGDWRSAKMTVPVGSFPANAFGLHDMHGNVWEWCEDVWHETYDGAPSDGSAWASGGDDTRRVARGGAWSSIVDRLRSAYRDEAIPYMGVNSFGFRLARDLEG
jgi:formylglycine-generating enzyme required for sulfatase activity